jgi:hypothetical protein
MGFFSRITGTDKYGAAQSALIAKYTFSTLTEDDKKMVVKVASQILVLGGYPQDKVETRIAKLREDEMYCLYSMAMAEIGMKPSLKGILYQDEWYPITNPFAALATAEKQILAARYEIKKKYNIEIEFNR